MQTSLRQIIGLVLLGILLSFVLLESGLRTGGAFFSWYQECHNLKSIQRNGAYRILCIGESTTADLPPPVCYPRQLENILNEKIPGIQFSVINKGIPAVGTGAILEKIESFLEKYRPDMVIAMMGINDPPEELLNPADLKKNSGRKWFDRLKSLKLLKLIASRLTRREETVGPYPGLEEESVIDNESPGRTEESADPLSATFKTALALREKGRWHEARVHLEQALKERPGNASVYMELAACYMHLNEYDRGLAYFEKAAALFPEDPAAQSELGVQYYGRGNNAAAEAQLVKAFELDPHNLRTAYTLVMLYFEKDELSKALSVAEKNAAANPRSDNARGLLGRVYQIMKEPRLAKEYFAEANANRLWFSSQQPHKNYLEILKRVQSRGIRFVSMQYPVRSIKPLKEMLQSYENIIFIDNEAVFKNALKENAYSDIFTDMFGGDFGHCTTKGNRLLAENAANTLLEKVFKI